MARIYCGNLPIDIREREIEDLFYKYGRIRDIDLKTPSRPPAFAFISFDDERDAEDAIRGRDNYDFDGHRLRVEFSRGRGERDRGGASDRDRGGASSARGGGGRRSEFRVNVSNLPRSCSWQDLKDYMRKAGDVIHADVDRDGGGVVEYSNESDMENAVRKLDDTEFKNPFDKTFIRVKFANARRERSASRSRSRDRSRRSPSGSRSRSRSASRDKDRNRDASRSRSRSRSGSPARKGSRSPSPARAAAAEDDNKE